MPGAGSGSGADLLGALILLASLAVGLAVFRRFFLARGSAQGDARHVTGCHAGLALRCDAAVDSRQIRARTSRTWDRAADCHIISPIIISPSHGNQQGLLQGSGSEQCAPPLHKELLRHLTDSVGHVSLARLGSLLGALVQEGFKEPWRLEAMCEMGLAHSLGLALRELSGRLLEAHGMASERHTPRPAQSCSSPQALLVARGGEAGAVGPGGDTGSAPAAKDIGAACLQVSWLLVQLTAGRASTKRAVLRGVTVRTLVAFMRSMAPEDLVTCCIHSCGGASAATPGLPASSCGGAAPPNAEVSPLPPARHQSSLLPQALLDAVLRNCSWSLLQLCDSAGAPEPRQGHGGNGEGVAAVAAALGAAQDTAVPVQVGLELLPEPQRCRDTCDALAETGGAAAAGATGSEDYGMQPCAPGDVLVRLLQRWECLEVALAAGGVLAALALLEDAEPGVAGRARSALLGPHTLDVLCEALCRVGAVDGLPAGPSGGPSAPADEAPAAAASVLSRPMGRPCSLLSRFFSRTLSVPTGAAQLLRQAVADHAVSWLLHAPALPLPLRRQLLRQLLGAEGHSVLMAPSLHPLDGPLALCHVISAPPKCHTMLPPGVAGFLLAATPFGFGPSSAPGEAMQPHLHQQAPGAEDVQDPGWQVLAAMFGAQAQGAIDQQAQQNGMALPLPAAHGAAGADLRGPEDELNNMDVTGHSGGPSERPVSTLAVACRLLLAGGRLDSVLSAFFGDLRASRCLSEQGEGPTSSGTSPFLGGSIRGAGGPGSYGNGDWLPAALAATMGGSSGGGGGCGCPYVPPTGPRGQSPADAGAVSFLLRDGSSIEPVSGAGGELPPGGVAADWPLPQPPQPLSAGGRTTPGLTEEGFVIGYRWPHSEAGSPYGRADGSSGGDKASSCQSGGGWMTDVMAGVAGLIDTMVWRSASLGDLRGLRGSGVDHADSMSESLTATAAGTATEELSGRGDGSGRGGGCALAAAPAAATIAAPYRGAHAVDWEGVLEEGAMGCMERVLAAATTTVGDQPSAACAARGAVSAGPAAALAVSSARDARRARRAVIDVRSGVRICSGTAAAAASGGGPSRVLHIASLARDSSVSSSGREAEVLTSDEEEEERAEVSAAALSRSAAAAWLSSSSPLARRYKRVSAPAGTLPHRASSSSSSGGASGPGVAGSPALLSRASSQEWRAAEADGAEWSAASSGSGPERAGSAASRSAEPALGGADVGARGNARLPPYTFFCATRLTAAALAVAPDVAEAAASTVSASGRAPNTAAREIAVATAAAAAAAAAGGTASSTFRTVTSSAAAVIAAAKAAGGAYLEGDSDGVWHGETGGLLKLADARRSVSDTRLASDTHTCSASAAPAGQWSDGAEAYFSAASCGPRCPAEEASPFSTGAAPPAPTAQAAACASVEEGAWFACAAQATWSPPGVPGSDSPGMVSALSFGADAEAAHLAAPLPRGTHQLLPSQAAPEGGARAALPPPPPPAPAPAGAGSVGVWGSLQSSGSPDVVFAFGDEQVEVPMRAFRALRRCSPLLYGWLSRVPDCSRPITIVRVPGLSDRSNSRMFRSLVAWAQGARDVGALVQGAEGRQLGPAEAQGPDGAALQQLQHLWQAADYLQVDELLVAVEDELSRRFCQPAPAGLAAWSAALGLAAQQPHASSRLAGLCGLHLMRHVWAVLADDEARGVAAAAAGVLGPAVAAEVRDRLVALVALSDQDVTGYE